MNAKELKSRAKKLGASVKTVNSQYWGKTWHEAVFNTPVVSIQVTFEDNQLIAQCCVLGQNDLLATDYALDKSAEMQKQIAALIREYNQQILEGDKA